MVVKVLNMRKYIDVMGDDVAYADDFLRLSSCGIGINLMLKLNDTIDQRELKPSSTRPSGTAVR